MNPESLVFAHPVVSPETVSGETFILSHLTVYDYDNEIRSSEHWLRLMPVNDRRQHVLEFHINVEPEGLIQAYQDPFGNEVLHVQIHKPYHRLSIESRGRVRVLEQEVYDASHVRYPLSWVGSEWEALLPYLKPDLLPESQLRILANYARSFIPLSDGSVYNIVDNINQAIYREFRYIPGSTHIGTDIFSVFCHREGVCQDFTSLMICLLRLLQIPARYRTGYLFTGQETQDRQIVPDASHAWVEVFLPHRGWCGWDPTNGKSVGAEHIRIAAGRTYREATPTAGTLYTPFEQEELKVRVNVQKFGGLYHAL